jgi:PEGA domain
MDTGNRGRDTLKTLRPLAWWLLLALILFAIHWNAVMLERTRLYFSTSLNGQPVPYFTTETLDGIPIASGDKIFLGKHRFEITSPQTDPITMDLSIWYGRHDLGEIHLKRSTGTLSVSAAPAAQRINVQGAEFWTTLSNTVGTNLLVPTGSYTVNAQFAHWMDSRTVSVTRDTTSPVVFSPQLGALHLTSNKNDATYRLYFAGGQSVESGNLPATLLNLPIGNYTLDIRYHSRQLQKTVTVSLGTTNDVTIQFILGAAELETTPAGVDVRTSDGSYLGQTPLTVSDMTPQTAQFSLLLGGYEPVSVTLDITADQTNFYSTNLVSVNYLSAMRYARAYLDASNYDEAVQEATAALNAKPNDADALALQSQASSFLSVERHRLERLQYPKRDFDWFCDGNADAGLFTEHELITTKPASAVDEAVIAALTNSPSAFVIVQLGHPNSDTYEIEGQQTFSLGILGGTERDCLIVVGQSKDHETQIWFKVLEFEVQHTVVANGLLNFHDEKQLIPIHPSRMVITDDLRARVQEGIQTVAGKIQNAAQ